MFSKSKLNFAVDAMILLAFLAAAVSGIVLLTQPHGGYQGGRNPNFGQTVLFLSRDGWMDFHVWGSLAMIAGIVVHLALHWRWIVCMVKRLTATGYRGAALGRVQPVPVVVTDLDN
ncbi:MAG: DUF4405 domain-containing protein [Anaerolineae bacterium]|nr:DUF4405 domain-containing protein [Anaerolineae bacterium]